MVVVCTSLPSGCWCSDMIRHYCFFTQSCLPGSWLTWWTLASVSSNLIWKMSIAVMNADSPFHFQITLCLPKSFSTMLSTVALLPFNCNIHNPYDPCHNMTHVPLKTYSGMIILCLGSYPIDCYQTNSQCCCCCSSPSVIITLTTQMLHLIMTFPLKILN